MDILGMYTSLVSAHPIAATASTFIAGVILGFILFRSRKKKS